MSLSDAIDANQVSLQAASRLLLLSPPLRSIGHFGNLLRQLVHGLDDDLARHYCQRIVIPLLIQLLRPRRVESIDRLSWMASRTQAHSTDWHTQWRS